MTGGEQARARPAAKALHPRNRHRHGYDFPALAASHPPLAAFLQDNGHGEISIPFDHPEAVQALNAALLRHDYGIVDWAIPDEALCPPIPGRADYIHYMADLLGGDRPARGSDISLLDIGTGASGIYALLACRLYGWRCVGSDISEASLANVARIIAANPSLQGSVTLRRQDDKHQIFSGIIQPGEHFDVTVCNPPFHASAEDAAKETRRKVRNLGRPGALSAAAPTRNFGGQADELWCNGGERLFLKKMIKDSCAFAAQCRWFTSLVAKAEHLEPARKWLRKCGATEVRTIAMAQGAKRTRVLAWTFMS